jgi:hypothetical protein
VASRERGEAMLSEGIVMPPGIYWFTDGNSAGGVGCVMVEQGSDGPLCVVETKTSVRAIFQDAVVPGLETSERVDVALESLRNILSEMAGLFHVLGHAERGSGFTIVYDYAGVAQWMRGGRCRILREHMGVATPLDGRFKRDGGPIVAAVVRESQRFVDERSLAPTFQYQPAHQSTWCGRDDFAHWNGRADHLATEGAATS